MSGQIGDIYRYQNQKFNIVSMSKPMTFNPEMLGLKPRCICSVCWKGFWCEYEITQGGIILTDFYIHTEDDIYPDINGVAVNALQNSDDHFGHRLYSNLHIGIEFSGKLLLGDGIITEYLIHFGHANAWAYKELKEFVFENGMLAKINDYSQIAKDIRQCFKQKCLNEDEFSQFEILDKIAKEKLPIDYDIHRANWYYDI